MLSARDFIAASIRLMAILCCIDFLVDAALPLHAAFLSAPLAVEGNGVSSGAPYAILLIPVVFSVALAVLLCLSAPLLADICLRENSATGKPDSLGVSPAECVILCTGAVLIAWSTRCIADGGYRILVRWVEDGAVAVGFPRMLHFGLNAVLSVCGLVLMAKTAGICAWLGERERDRGA